MELKKLYEYLLQKLNLASDTERANNSWENWLPSSAEGTPFNSPSQPHMRTPYNSPIQRLESDTLLHYRLDNESLKIQLNGLMLVLDEEEGDRSMNDDAYYTMEDEADPTKDIEADPLDSKEQSKV